jgi:arsenate reductase
MKKAVIFHNPRCSTSRNVLAMLKDAGRDVEVVEYLKNPPSRERLKALYAKAGITPRQGLRTKEAGAAALVGASDDAILDAMAKDPILIERPIVETERGVRLGRPVEKVREIL